MPLLLPPSASFFTTLSSLSTKHTAQRTLSYAMVASTYIPANLEIVRRLLRGTTFYGTPVSNAVIILIHENLTSLYILVK